MCDIANRVALAAGRIEPTAPAALLVLPRRVSLHQGAVTQAVRRLILNQRVRDSIPESAAVLELKLRCRIDNVAVSYLSLQGRRK